MKILARCTPLLTIAAVLVTLNGFAANSGAPLVATLDGQSLRLAGVTAGGRVALFAVSLRSEGGIPTMRKFAELLNDSDHDGTILYEPRAGVPLRSIWVSVDVASGAAVTAAPAGYDLHHYLLDEKAMRKTNGDEVDAIVLEHLNLDFLLVRPGDGAWTMRAREGGTRDGDRARDGKLTIRFEDADPLDAAFGKAPKHAKKGDVVVAIDPQRLELFTYEATK